MRSCRRKLKTILIILFAVNTLSFYLYHHRRRHSPPEIRRTFAVDRFDFNYSYQHILTKPWPILPSYLPWNVESDAPFRSCEGYFGNGFNRRVGVISASYKANRKTGVSDAGGWFRTDVILGSYKANRRTGVSDAEGWFRCFYSDTLRSSICEGGKVRMHPEKIKMSSGGEKLEMVIGRSEDDELPVFDSGAFDIEVADRAKHGKKLVDNEFLNQYLQPGEISRHTMRNLVDSIQLIGAKDFECTEWIEEPTLLITRFEYANVFHTFTDWYSAYVASRVTGLPYRPNVVFVDGHCVTQLEETWRALFSNVTYAKHFNGPVCFRHAILSPLGYETAWFKGLSEEIDCHGGSAHDLWRNPDIHKTARLSEFGEMIRAAFGFQVHRNRTTKSTSGLNVLFVRREDYLAHPRHGGKVESRLNNEEEVFDAIRNWVSNHLSCKINLVNGLFAHMPMKEQVRAIQDASVIIGAHGAGLTHIVSANPKAVVLEIISSEYRRPHFALIAQWKALEYHAINLVGSYANPPEVIERFSSILKSLGC